MRGCFDVAQAEVNDKLLSAGAQSKLNNLLFCSFSFLVADALQLFWCLVCNALGISIVLGNRQPSPGISEELSEMPHSLITAVNIWYSLQML